jgi:hypothetical protein
MKTNLLLILLLLGSCTAQKHLDLALKKDPNLLKSDTVITHDTVVTKEVTTDTLLDATEIHDTITIREEKLTMKYYYNTHDSTVYLEGKCDRDTLIIEKERITNNIIKSPDWWIKVQQWWWVALVIVFVIVVIRLTKKVGI